MSALAQVETTQLRQTIQSRQRSPQRPTSEHRNKFRSPLAILAIWALCGFWAYGLRLGHFTHEFPRSNDDIVAPVAAALGPISLAVELVTDGPHYYWSLHPPPKDSDFERNYH